jgi:hypothetical protein
LCLSECWDDQAAATEENAERVRTRRAKTGIPAPLALVRFAFEWAWTLVAITWVGVAALVFLCFFTAFTGL